jgi:hypothetical protein
MSQVLFPEFVNGFIQMTEECLEHFDMKISLGDENSDGQIRSYELIGAPFKTIFMVHRTQRSFDREDGEYRARIITEIPDQLSALLQGKDAQVNHLATLGAMISNDEGVDVCAQCLIDPYDTGNLAGLCAASMVQSAESLIHSQASILNPDHANKDAVHEMSAWGDLDFEQIQYDYAHLGTGRHNEKEWSIKLGVRDTLTLTAVQNNPFYGGGLLSLLWVPREEFDDRENVISIKMLNDVEHLFGEAPTFGGWCDDGDNYVFTSFFPNYLKNLNGITDSIINWAIIRSQMIKPLIEVSTSISEK